MIPREILKKFRQIEIRTSLVVSEAVPGPAREACSICG